MASTLALVDFALAVMMISLSMVVGSRRARGVEELAAGGNLRTVRAGQGKIVRQKTRRYEKAYHILRM